MLESKRLLLIPMDIEMIDTLLESNEAFKSKYGYTNDGGPFVNPSPDYLVKLKQRLIDYPEEYPVATDFLIIIKDINTVIGSIDFKYLPNEEGISEIGYGMTQTYEGKGYMTEAVNMMLEYGKQHGIKTVVADTTFQNAKSQNVLKRCGFTVISVEESKLWFIKR